MFFNFQIIQQNRLYLLFDLKEYVKYLHNLNLLL